MALRLRGLAWGFLWPHDFGLWQRVLELMGGYSLEILDGGCQRLALRGLGDDGYFVLKREPKGLRQEEFGLRL